MPTQNTNHYNRVIVEIVGIIIALITIVCGVIIAAYDAAYGQQPRRVFASRCPTLALEDSTEIRVAAVVDGDTFRVNTQVIDSVTIDNTLIVSTRDTVVSVRIVGIDTYERRLTEKLYRQARDAGITPSEALQRGERGLEFARRHLLGRTVWLCRDPRTPAMDIYCRPLYRVWIVGVDGQVVEYAALVRRAGLTDQHSRWNDEK